MLAFTDTAVTKIQLVESLERHAAVDAFIKGQYWSDGKGCAVGCSLHDFHAEPGDHAAYVRLGLVRELFTADELDAAAAVLTQLAEALRNG